MKYLLDDAYPRRYRGYNRPIAFREQCDIDYTSLESVVARRGTSIPVNRKERNTDLRKLIVKHLPVGISFNAPMVQALIPGDEVDIEAVSHMMSVLVNEGYPLKRVCKGWYLYTPRRGGEV